MAKKIFSNLPSNPMTFIIAWLLLFGTLYFDFIGNYQTNPILIFSPAILFVLIALPKDRWSNIRNALGLTIPKDRYWLAVPLFLGGILGAWLFTRFVLGMNITNGLYVVPLASGSSPASGISYSISLNTVIAIFENSMLLVGAKIFANYISDKGWGIDKTTIILIAGLIGLSSWASLHFFSYTIASGLGIGAYLSIILVGSLMMGIPIAFDFIYSPESGIQWVYYPAYFGWGFHITYNVIISLHMATIAFSFLGIPVVS